MTLESYTKQETEHLIAQSVQQRAVEKQLEEWDGRDFRGDKCEKGVIEFLKKHPLVYQWLRTRPRGSIHRGARALIPFCKFANITPEKFLLLNEKEARDLLWDFVDSIKMKHPATAKIARNFGKNFYLYHNEKALVFIRGKHDIICEPSRIKIRMSKEICWRLINKTKNLRDETILTMAYESGLRINALAHLNYGHVKRFKWFYDHTITVFKVLAKKNSEYTYDNKLRGKGINWYYGCLHKEATKTLKKYIEQYHEDSKPERPLFYSLIPFNKDVRLKTGGMRLIVKVCAKNAGLNTKEITFHGLRRGFRSVVRNTGAITDAEFKEAIMGHKLKGSQENYFDKDPKEFAREYLKCDFSMPTEISKELQKEVEQLREQVAEMKAKQPSLDEQYKQYQRDFAFMKTQPQPKPIPQAIKSEPGPLPKPLSKPTIASIPNIPKPALTVADQKEGYFTCQNDFQAYLIKDLPCIKDINYNCAKRICHKQVLDLIKYYR